MVTNVSLLRRHPVAVAAVLCAAACVTVVASRGAKPALPPEAFAERIARQVPGSRIVLDGTGGGFYLTTHEDDTWLTLGRLPRQVGVESRWQGRLAVSRSGGNGTTIPSEDLGSNHLLLSPYLLYGDPMLLAAALRAQQER